MEDKKLLTILPESLPAPLDIKNTQEDAEYEYARKNIIEIIENSKKVVKSTTDLAVKTDDDRIIRVYSDLIKNVVEVNKSLFDIREKRMKLKGEINNVEEAVPHIVNNAVFIGSSEDLLQKLNKKNEK